MMVAMHVAAARAVQVAMRCFMGMPNREPRDGD